MLFPWCGNRSLKNVVWSCAKRHEVKAKSDEMQPYHILITTSQAATCAVTTLILKSLHLWNLEGQLLITGVSYNAGVVKYFFPHCSIRSEMSAISLS